MKSIYDFVEQVNKYMTKAEMSKLYAKLYTLLVLHGGEYSTVKRMILLDACLQLHLKILSPR